MEKKCGVCGVTKDEKCFWVRDGGRRRHNQCADCLSKRHKVYYQRHKEKLKDNARTYYQEHYEEQRKNHVRWYLENRNKPEFKAYHAKATREYNAEHRDDPRILARKAVYYAVKVGKLIRKPCEICGFSGRTHAHHHKGYELANWFDVQWLCYRHHVEAHGGQVYEGG